MIKVVGFDLDGTIADTIPICLESINKAVLPYMEEEITDQDIVKTFGLNEKGMLMSIVGEKWEDALNDFYKHYQIMHKECTDVFQGIKELIDDLIEKGVKVVLITGKGKKSCDITLGELNLVDRFEQIITGSESGNNKASQMKIIVDKYNIKPDEFCYIGDSVTDVHACREACVKCLSAAWAEGTNVMELKKINTPYVYSEISELKKYLSDS